jgi:hypothetical protein
VKAEPPKALKDAGARPEASKASWQLSTADEKLARRFVEWATKALMKGEPK